MTLRESIWMLIATLFCALLLLRGQEVRGTTYYG